LSNIGTASTMRRFAAVDEPQHSFADASDVILTPDDKYGFLAVAGSDQVPAVDIRKLL
jgi:hypothetical protein